MENTYPLLIRWTNRIPIRWRLTFVTVGLLTVLLSGLGIVILLTAEHALLSNEATALRNEANLAIKGTHDHLFSITPLPGPPTGPQPANLKLHAEILAQKLASASANATILSPQGTVIVPASGLQMVPLPVEILPSQVRQTLQNDPQGTSYLIAHDSQGNRQLVVFIPLVSQYHTIAILQLSTPTETIDSFITTLRLILFFGIAGALGLAIALTFPLVGAALRPLVEMERMSRRIAEGALSMRLQVPLTNDEIGHLALSFNRMVTQLENAFKRQKQFVADVSHELRTPLTALSGSLEMLLIGADQGDAEATRHLVRGMYAEFQRMQRLIEDLLALTRLDEGKIILHETTIDLQVVIDKVYKQAQQLAHGQNIHCKITPNLPPVRADIDRLQQVLLNIIDNALKFTATNGDVRLTAYSKESTTAIIEVHDNGKGIPVDALPHVFNRFYRADPARSRSLQNSSGNGLGLAIAKDLINAQGGTISITSVEGRGTTVTIQLLTATDTPLRSRQDITRSSGYEKYYT